MITLIGEAIAALCFIIAVILMFIDAEEYSVAMIILMCVSIGVAHTAQSAPRQQATSNYTQAPPPNYTQSAPRQQAAPNYTQAPPSNHTQTNNTNAAAKEVVFCIHCKQKLRIPTDKGTITVSCPVCKNSFKYTPNK